MAIILRLIYFNYLNFYGLAQGLHKFYGGKRETGK